MNENALFICNLEKIKYSVLREKVLANAPFDGKRINLYIDTDYIFKAFRTEYTKEATKKLSSGGKINALLVEFLNFVSHYKHFLADHFEADLRVFILHGYHSSEIGYYDKGEDFDEEDLVYFDKVIERMKKLTSLTSNIFVVQSESIPKFAIPYLFDKDSTVKGRSSPFKSKKPINLFITKNPKFLQYSYLIDNFYLLDKSLYNSLHSMQPLHKKLKSITSVDRYYLVPYLAICGFDRNEGMRKITNAKFFKPSDLQNYFTYENSSNSKAIIEFAEKEVFKDTLSKEEKLLIEDRVKLIDIPSIIRDIKESDKLEVINSLSGHIEDSDAIHRLNSDNFRNSLNIDYLL
jgi:hypothetical protein